MTSCALRYDVIYHPSPINSQYLNTSYVGSWQPRKCPLWKGVFDQMLALYWSSSYTRVTMWASTAPIITKCTEYNNPQFNDNNKDLKIQRRDGNENVAQKVNLRSFSLHRNYSYPLTLSNVGEPSWSWILGDHMQVQKEKLNFVVACLRPPYNPKLRVFTS